MEIKFGPSGRLVMANTMNPVFRAPRAQLVGPFADLSLIYPNDAPS